MKFSTNRIASENEKYEKNGKQTINFYNFSEQTSSNRDARRRRRRRIRQLYFEGAKRIGPEPKSNEHGDESPSTWSPGWNSAQLWRATGADDETIEERLWELRRKSLRNLFRWSSRRNWTKSLAWTEKLRFRVSLSNHVVAGGHRGTEMWPSINPRTSTLKRLVLLKGLRDTTESSRCSSSRLCAYSL